jgi:DnaJ-class molecular chaperone
LYRWCNEFQNYEEVWQIVMTTCPICKGSGKLPVTQEPKAESHGEETVSECPTCYGKGEVDK